MKGFHADALTPSLPPGHRFPSAKYAMLHARVLAELPSLVTIPAQPATDGQLALAHSPDYIQAVVSGNLSPAAQREIGFPWSEAMVRRARGSVGATISAARTAWGAGEKPAGMAVNLGGGTHHAGRAKGGGFCVFNDVAVAARLLQAEHGQRYGVPLHVAVIDLDVHQGNGTAEIFDGDDTVFTLSLHGEKNFPFRKVNGSLDIALPDWCTDDTYIDALDLGLEELEHRFDPDLIFFLAGADCHEGDRLGRLKLNFDGMRARDRRVFEWAWLRRLPVVTVMAGGYGHDLATTVQVQVNTLEMALEYAQRWQNRRP